MKKKNEGILTSVILVVFDLAACGYGEDYEAQEASEDDLSQEGLNEVVAGSNGDSGKRSADNTAEKGAEDAATDLEDPIHEHLMQRHASADEDGEGNGRVVVGAGNGHAGVHDGDEDDADGDGGHQ